VIHPRAQEDVQRGPGYQLYRLVPLDMMEISTRLGLENYTPDGVEKAIANYWRLRDSPAVDARPIFIRLFGSCPCRALGH
jgi:hypothetical protein